MSRVIPAEYLIPKNFHISDNPAIFCGEKIVSYAQFCNSVSAAENYLKDLGVQPNDRVAILSPNSVDYLVGLFALWNIGAVACLLSTRLPDDTLNEQLQLVGCRYFLTTTDKRYGQNIVHINLFDVADSQETQQTSDFRYLLEQEATIVFTSGSTARPKAVLHTLGNHYYSAKGANEHISITPDDRWLLSLPLYHVGGLGIVFRTFLGGGSIAIAESQENIEDVLKRYDPTHISLVPTQLIRLLKNNDSCMRLKNLKAILIGGSAVSDSLIDECVRRGLPIYATYGLTEMASQVATSEKITDNNRIAMAKILNYRRVMISEEDEIVVKGETLFSGYVEGQRLHLPVNRNGLFATGDLGCFSDDGNLIITGRKDNMFISGGENIQPEEIERVLCELRAIEQAVVVPVEHDEFGFRPTAFVKTSDDLNSNDILTHLNKSLPKFKIPDQFYVWPEELAGESFKIDRQKLIQLANNSGSLQGIS